MITFDTSGLQAAFKEMANKITDAAGEATLRATGFAGAAIFREEAKVNAGRNKKTGAIQRNIIVKRLTEESNGKRQAYLVTVRSGKFNTDGDAFYWRFVEFGTAHSAAQPFLRPAYESKKQAAIDAMGKTLAAKLKEKLGG